ncbi:MAG: murein biosynthesis integral membrane protein MurJ [Actinomycetota bacterium]
MGKEVPAATDGLSPPDTPEDTGPLPAPSAQEPPADSTRAVVRQSAVMSLGTALSRLTGFLRLAAMAFALGVAESRLADAYNVANTTPNIVYDLALGGMISSIFIPVFVERLEGEGREQAWHTARSLLTFSILILGALMLLGIVFSEPLIRMYTYRASGPEAESMRELASFFLKWFMPQIVFYGLGAGVATGLLNAHRRFAAPMFAPIVNNLIAMATFFTFAALPGGSRPETITDLQRYVLAIGTTLGVIGMTVALWPSLRALGFRYRWTLDLWDRGFRKIVRLAGWAFMYVIVNQLGLLVVILLAASVQGGYTAYAAAFIFFQLPYAVFAVSIMTALLPTLSSRWLDGERDTFRLQLSRGIRGTAFIVVPAAFGYIALAEPIVRVLLEHGVMRAESTELVAGILTGFSLGLLPFCAFQLFLRAFYAMQDTRMPAIINVGAVGLNTVVNLVFFRYLQVEGLALGHATAYTFAALVSALILRRRLGGLGGRGLAKALGQIAVAGAATGATAYAVARLMAATLGTADLGAQAIQVGAAVVAGIGCFLGLAQLFRLQELRLIRQFVMARVGRS